ncbi:MAG: SDR family NAD(P)-dependent oxidoreductase [Acidimicrobiia bacterium]
MEGKRVLITGGAGLVGSTIADRLCDEGVAEIRILDNFDRGRMANLEQAVGRGPVTVFEGDIRDRETVDAATAGCDLVFHEAAIRITQCAEDPRLALEVLVDGTFNVADAAVRHGIEKVVFASSASVYGQADEFPTTEAHHPYNNRTIYGAAKTFNEGLFRSFNEMYGLPYVGLRYFNVYGPRMDIHGVYTEVLIRWMERIAVGQPPLILGDGRQTMDFVYIDDIVDANVLAMKSSASDVVANVASGEETSLRELASALLHVMGSDLEPEHGPERKVNAVARRLAGTERAEALLGFRARVGLEEGLRSLVAWWRAEQAMGPAGAASVSR